MVGGGNVFGRPPCKALKLHCEWAIEQLSIYGNLLAFKSQISGKVYTRGGKIAVPAKCWIDQGRY